MKMSFLVPTKYHEETCEDEIYLCGNVNEERNVSSLSSSPANMANRHASPSLDTHSKNTSAIGKYGTVHISSKILLLMYAFNNYYRNHHPRPQELPNQHEERECDDHECTCTVEGICDCDNSISVSIPVNSDENSPLKYDDFLINFDMQHMLFHLSHLSDGTHSGKGSPPV